MRTGVILDDAQSRLLTEVFSEAEISESTQLVLIDLKKFRISPLTRAMRWYFQFVRGVTVPRSIACAEYQIVRLYARLGRLHVLVALDNKLELLSALAASLKKSETRCYVIQMGTNPRYYRSNRPINVKSVPVGMFCWGSRECESYSRSGLVPDRFFVVGSLKESTARRRNRGFAGKTWDLCIVSQFRPHPRVTTQVSASSRFEAESMPNLIQLLRPIIIRNQLRTVVALKAGRGVIEDSIEAEEIDYFHSTLGDIAEIGLSEDPFASYALAEASKLVVGRNSALLTEMLGSRSRVLFVNPTDYGLFDAPEDLPYQLSRPSESELEEQVLKLLDMSWIEYAKQVEPVSSKFCQRSDNSLETFANILKGVI